jgi:hypothetical protein
MYEAVIFLGEEEGTAWGTGSTARQAVRAAVYAAFDGLELFEENLDDHYKATTTRDSNLSSLNPIPRNTTDPLVLVALDRLQWPSGIVRNINPRHFVVLRYPLDEARSAVMSEYEIAFVGYSVKEALDYVEAQGASRDQCISFVFTRHDRPGDWEDAAVNDTHAFEIKEVK